ERDHRRTVAGVEVEVVVSGPAAALDLQAEGDVERLLAGRGWRRDYWISGSRLALGRAARNS
ncbi:MAG TPA: hypothetical protein VIX91_25000, partial [Candidatus Acidoferrum sp.]